MSDAPRDAQRRPTSPASLRALGRIAVLEALYELGPADRRIRRRPGHRPPALCDLSGEPVSDRSVELAVDKEPDETLACATELVAEAIAGMPHDHILGLGVGIAKRRRGYYPPGVTCAVIRRDPRPSH